MRKNLYKAKRLDNDEWVYGYFSALINKYTRERESFIQTVRDDGKAGVLHKVDPNTVCEYTGILDIYNSEIFEGDIIRALDASCTFSEYDGTIEFRDGSFVLAFIGEHLSYKLLRELSNIEVIGNIYDKKDEDTTEYEDWSLPYITRWDVLDEAANKFGALYQEYKTIEEMSGLTKALFKTRYSDPHNSSEYAADIYSVTEKMADVFIALAQLLILYDNTDEVQCEMDAMIDELAKKLEQAGHEN